MAVRTRLTVDGLTNRVPFMTWDTVAFETPARSATVAMLVARAASSLRNGAALSGLRSIGNRLRNRLRAASLLALSGQGSARIRPDGGLRMAPSGTRVHDAGRLGGRHGRLAVDAGRRSPPARAARR